MGRTLESCWFRKSRRVCNGKGEVGEITSGSGFWFLGSLVLGSIGLVWAFSVS